MAALDDLILWYQAQCDGDWEHQFGIRIGSLDNPGWVVRIDLRDTLLESLTFIPIEEGSGDTDRSWIACRVEKRQFVGMGDPKRLEEIIGRFIAWAKSPPDWLAVPDTATLAARNDREFWESLGPEVAGDKCRSAGCGRPRISQSVFCRRHQYESVTGRPCPY